MFLSYPSNNNGIIAILIFGLILIVALIIIVALTIEKIYNRLLKIHKELIEIKEKERN